MNDSPKEYIDFLFNKDEYACLGLNQYDIGVLSVEDILNIPDLTVFERITLNPLLPKSERNDNNITSFRTFMIESDTLDPKTFRDFVVKKEMPFSAVLFSGNKSLHYIIKLDEHKKIKSLEQYNFIAKWILNIMGKDYDIVDRQTTNPSRPSRLLGGINKKTGNVQKGKIKGPVPWQQLNDWIKQYPEHKPKIYKEDFKIISSEPNPMLLKPWYHVMLEEGIYNGKRNAMFYEISFGLAKCGFSTEQAIVYILEHSANYKTGDFSEREIRTVVYSAFKNIQRNLK
jgi:hypothetical protein